jgi:hypothetical protein
MWGVKLDNLRCLEQIPAPSASASCEKSGALKPVLPFLVTDRKLVGMLMAFRPALLRCMAGQASAGDAAGAVLRQQLEREALPAFPPFASLLLKLDGAFSSSLGS